MESPSSLGFSELLHAAGDPSHPSELSPANSKAASLADSSRERARYKLMSPAKLPISRSPCITIPPGLSPTSFLESPIFLSNMKAEPSPTTGSLFKPQPVCGSAGSTYTFTGDCSNAKTADEMKSDFFEFRPQMVTDANSADLNHQKAQVHGQCTSRSFPSLPSVTREVASSNELSLSSPSNMVASETSAPDEYNLNDSYQRGNTSTAAQAYQSEQKVAGPCDDGYNWRKYGQKLVKGSEFPRSYYKCTHPNCEVKKLFERSHDGQKTEIIYKGTHDHPKPQPSRRYSAGMVMPVQEDKPDKASLITGQDERSSNIYVQMSSAIDPNAPSQSSHATDDDTVGGMGSQPQRIHDEVEDNDDDSLSKRRKMDVDGIDVTAVVKPIREPRVVVQTVSEVDILDDGYRWRKYGQKVVRGNPNPRSYYKCTNAGCPVRKHVERASHDPKAVITTYEGKHNHNVPTAKVSSYDTAGPTIPPGPSRIKSEGSGRISLDLGVGISSAVNNRSNEQPQAFPEVIQCQPHNGNSHFKVVHAIPVSTYYDVHSSNVNRYGPRGNQNDDHSANILPINHSYPYTQNMGRIVTGP